MAAKKAQATKTVNPLHFEDLEPKRFEDLVRQLAYGFKSWRVLEPTGLLGDDEGIDIYGIEVEPEESTVERRWRFQCKRYKRLSPKAIRTVVHEVVPDPKKPPYGLVIAAACNFTSDAILAFHEEARNVGVAESHLWSKAKLEDLLFRPENDHLLFAYFGISLRTKRQSELAAIRHAMAVKRKLLSAVGEDNWSALQAHKEIVIRDVLDGRYPGEPTGKGMAKSWQVVRTRQLDSSHFGVEVRTYTGWVRPDGSWDIDKDTAEAPSLFQLQRDESAEQHELSSRRHRERYLLQEAVPAEERREVELLAFVPYSRIMEIDPTGHPGVNAPHVFCEYKRGDLGPYDTAMGFVRGFQGGWLDESKRDPSLFAELRRHVDLSEEAWTAHLKRQEEALKAKSTGRR
ncbi:MAG: restriction endonuclease [Thaumarchaeota archaeon]|nr:restriction endonuclease [Nitrososphaerota archaeon]